jgi:hypothetical protein
LQFFGLIYILSTNPNEITYGVIGIPFFSNQNIYLEQVSDRDGNQADEHTFTVRVRPVDNQPPVVQLQDQLATELKHHTAATAFTYRVNEGGTLTLSNESTWRITDADSADDHLTFVITQPPKFGHIDVNSKTKSEGELIVLFLVGVLYCRCLQQK